MKIFGMVAVVAVAALMACSLAAVATSDLLSSLHPDPYEHQTTYTLTGTRDGDPVTGLVSCMTVHENGAFHNYQFSVSYSESGAMVHADTFLIIFEPGDVPSLMTASGTTELGGIAYNVYSGDINGRDVTIAVGEYCGIHALTVSKGGDSYTAIIDD